MGKYTDIQNIVLSENKDAIINPDSKCWSRTHVHVESGPMRGMICKWKQAESYISTFTLLHEIGHIRTHKSTMTRAESETAATLWCIKTLRRFGIPIKRKVATMYKDYIRTCHDRAVRRGFKRKIKLKLYV